jgi:hypothetical protein
MFSTVKKKTENDTGINLNNLNDTDILEIIDNSNLLSVLIENTQSERLGEFVSADHRLDEALYRFDNEEMRRTRLPTEAKKCRSRKGLT